MNSLSFLQLEAVRQASSKVADLDALCTALSTVVFFSRLDEPTVQSLAKCVQYERFKPRQTVFSYGDYGDKYYLLLTGRVGVEVPVPQPNGAMHNLQVAILEAGAGFGEMALLEDMPRSATIQALEPTETLSLDREHYQALAMEKHREVFHRNVSFLQCLPFLVGCPTGDIKALAEQLVEKTYSGPEVIVRQGQEATQVVLVKRGSVLVLRTVNTGAKGKFFDLRKPAGGSPSSINDLGRSVGLKHKETGNGQQLRSQAGKQKATNSSTSALQCSYMPTGLITGLRKFYCLIKKGLTRAQSLALFSETSIQETDCQKKLVLQVATLGKQATYGAREILEGEKATAVQQRGSTYSATLVAFPAAQVRISGSAQNLWCLVINDHHTCVKSTQLLFVCYCKTSNICHFCVPRKEL
ncbi:cAMP-dependent protein kinase regulatory subunit [Cyclospora cayetanensis]|uniref:cAMP-dependent protein kinase regulatory subunit n=1 Tax=Cyclospora cayetanensis TaxID=88456 RepID=A0A6P6S1I6_9EIME|nr:cAMP-dependent protein kinase regulatory subunit [Cyclospora cayetanensis]